MKQLSVVIPVYNAEKYIEECLNSVVGSTVDDNIEVICVDDGSTDNSLKILKEKASLYKNITVIAKENGGASSARNAGLDRATGKYIWFVDADDYILPNVLERLMPILESGPELIAFDFSNDERNQIDRFELLKINKDKSNFPSTYTHCNIAELKIIKENHIKFNESLTYGEDALFWLQVAVLIKAVHRIENKLYFYRKTNDSLMNQLTINNESRKKRYVDLLKGIPYLMSLYKGKGENTSIKAGIIDIILIYNKQIVSECTLIKEVGMSIKKVYPLPLMIRLRYLRREKSMKKSDLFGMVFFPRMYLRRKIRKAKKVQA